jgi:hypothetical protein
LITLQITISDSLIDHQAMIELNIPNGIYFVSIYGGKKVSQTRKIIISK